MVRTLIREDIWDEKSRGDKVRYKGSVERSDEEKERGGGQNPKFLEV